MIHSRVRPVDCQTVSSNAAKTDKTAISEKRVESRHELNTPLRVRGGRTNEIRMHAR